MARCPKRILFLCLPATLGIHLSCASSQENQAEEPLAHSETRAEVLIEKEEPKGLIRFTGSDLKQENITPRFFHIPPELVRIARIVRPRVEVRGGPGLQFQIQDHILNQDHEVLVFDQVGVWRRIVLLAPSWSDPRNLSNKKPLIDHLDSKTWFAGWVHHKTLSEPYFNSKKIILNSQALPTVFAVRPINEAFSFQRNHLRPVKIPKGTYFKTFGRYGWRTLVWVTGTRSVVWLRTKDVQ